jgi:hypothetical protein
MVDLGRVDPRALEQGTGGVDAKVDGRDVGERAVVLGHRGAHSVDQDQVTYVHQRGTSVRITF